MFLTDNLLMLVSSLGAAFAKTCEPAVEKVTASRGCHRFCIPLDIKDIFSIIGQNKQTEETVCSLLLFDADEDSLYLLRVQA